MRHVFRVSLLAMSLVSVLAGPARAQQDVLTNDDIVLMTARGLANELIIGLIEVAEVAFDLSETGTTALLEAGVSDDVLIAMLGRISVPLEFPAPAEPPVPEDVAAEGTGARDTPDVAGGPTGSSTSSTPANADVGRAAERRSPWLRRWKWVTAVGGDLDGDWRGVADWRERELLRLRLRHFTGDGGAPVLSRQ